MDRSQTPRASQQNRQTAEPSSRKAKNRSRSGSEELSQIVAQAQANARAARYSNGFAPLQDAHSRPATATPTPYNVERGNGEPHQRVTSPGLLGWMRSALMLGPSGRMTNPTADQQSNGNVSSLPMSNDPIKRNQTPLLPGILPSFHNVNRFGSREEATSPISKRSISSSSLGQESIEAYDRRNRRASSMSTASSASVYDHNHDNEEEDDSGAEDVYAPYAQLQHGPSLVRPTARREALGFGPVDDLDGGIAGGKPTGQGAADTMSTVEAIPSSQDRRSLSISEAQNSGQYVVDVNDRRAAPDLVISPDPTDSSRRFTQSPLAGWFDSTQSKTPTPRSNIGPGAGQDNIPGPAIRTSLTNDTSFGERVGFRTADDEVRRVADNANLTSNVESLTTAYLGDGEDLNDQLGRPKSPEELLRSRGSRESVVLGSRGATTRAGGAERASGRAARQSSGLDKRGDRIDEAEEPDHVAPGVQRRPSLGGADVAPRPQETKQSRRPITSSGATTGTTATATRRPLGLFGRRRLGNVSEPGQETSVDGWDDSDTAASDVKAPSAVAKPFWRSSGKKDAAASKDVKQARQPVLVDEVGGGPCSLTTKQIGECTTESLAKRKQIRGALDSAMHPRKVKVRSRNKSSKERDFARLYLAQELFLSPSAADKNATSTGTPASSPKPDDDVESFGNQNEVKTDGGEPGNDKQTENSGSTKRRATWAMRFSIDGKYLAVAGQDAIIRVYAVLDTPEARQEALLETIEGVAGCKPISAHKRSATNSTAVSSSTEDDFADAAGKSIGGNANCPVDLPHLLVFSQTPVREFRGHTSDILDLSWSKGGFLISAGMDCTARIWHISKPSSLVTFKHGDFVTCVVFHPRDDRFFLSGSLDGKLRLWNISTKRVQASQEVPGLITACAFTHSGKTACVGTFSGAALFYHTEDLVFLSSVAVRSATGKYQKGGRKITAIEPILPDTGASSTSKDDHIATAASKKDRERVLITSNDSRVRAYDLANNTIIARFKARSYNNRSSQIKATLSDDNVYVVAGSEAGSNSEGGQVHVWECSSILFEGSTHSMLAKLASTGISAVASANQRTTGLLRSSKVGSAGGEKELEKVMQKSKNRSAVTADSVVEYFTAHAGTVTCAIMAPLRTNTLLRQANDPILKSSEEKLKNSRLASSANLVETIAGLPINIGRGLAYAIQTPLRMGANAVTNTVNPRPASTTGGGKEAAASTANDAEMDVLNRKLNRIILTVDDNAIVRVWRSDSLQTIPS